MPIIKELKAHISKASPAGRGVLTKAAAKMSPKQQQDFLASLQLGDAEFQTAVQDRMPEGADPVDPSRFRHHDYDIPGKSMNLNVAGNYITPNNPEGRNRTVRTRYGNYSLPAEPDTVNTYGLGNNLTTIAHEYRHRQGLEGLPPGKYGTNADSAEYLNTIQDLVGVENERELRKELQFTAFGFKNAEWNKKYHTRASEIAELAKDPDTPLEELVEGARFFLDHHATQNMTYDAVRRGDKNKRKAEDAGEDPAFKDTMSPDNFRTSRFYDENIKEKSFLDKLRQVVRD
jgi:hypothetical protein